MLHIVQTALTYTLPFLAVLTLVVTVHEFGHFLVARMFGVAMDRFSIGFGRALASFHDKTGMEWRIGWLPLGGYVRFAGDENAASVPDADDLAELRKQVLSAEGPTALKRYFHFKPLWQRALVVVAGPAANFVLAIVIFAALAMIVGHLAVKPRIGTVTPGAPAAAAGFKAGDLVVRADGRAISDFADIQQVTVLRSGEPIAFDVLRGGQTVHLVATPARVTRKNPVKGLPVGLGYLGLSASLTPNDVRVVRYGPVEALGEGVRKTGAILGQTIFYIHRIFTGYESGDQLSGILGIAGGTGQAATEATRGAPDVQTAALSLLLTLANLAAFISVAVGFANLLPIPVLDGGHLLFYGYEAVARRPLSAHVQAAGYRMGFALLIGLMLFVTWNDLQRLRVFHLIGGLFS